MKNYVLTPTLLLACLFSQLVLANSGSEWHNGEIVLNSGEVLNGHLSYSDEIVQCKVHNTIKAYSTFQVAHFQFYDTELNTNRTFVPITNSVIKNVQAPSFYELVVEGPITLLRKETYTYKLANDPQKDRDLAWETQTVRRFEYDVHMRVQDFEYFYIHDQNLNALRNFRKEIAPLLHEYQTDINHFIEKNALNTRDIESQIKVITYFNRLCNDPSMAYHQ